MGHMFMLEPAESMQESADSIQRGERRELALGKAVHEEFSVCVGGLGTESTRLQPPLSCYHSNLRSELNPPSSGQ